MTTAVEVVGRGATRLTHRIRTLPILVLLPHSRCNCRCVMCDIWKANNERRELTVEELAGHLEQFRRLRVRRIVLSGGEALMHSNLWLLCQQLSTIDAKLTLLSTGLLLERNASNVVRWIDDVIVSIDGPPEIHDQIRNIPRAFERLSNGVAALKRLNPAYRVTGRCVVQRRNFQLIPRIVDAAREAGLEQISFLAADVSSEAFNRPQGWDASHVSDVALNLDEARLLAAIVEEMSVSHAISFANGFIAESPAKLGRIADYYLALNRAGEFPKTTCNAPWVSAVIEADGTVRPCFFHLAYGNIHDQPVDDILNSAKAIGFRRSLDVTRNEICRRCVCTLNLGLRAPV